MSNANFTHYSFFYSFTWNGSFNLKQLYIDKVNFPTLAKVLVSSLIFKSRANFQSTFCGSENQYLKKCCGNFHGIAHANEEDTFFSFRLWFMPHHTQRKDPAWPFEGPHSGWIIILTVFSATVRCKIKVWGGEAALFTVPTVLYKKGLNIFENIWRLVHISVLDVEVKNGLKTFSAGSFGENPCFVFLVLRFLPFWNTI